MSAGLSRQVCDETVRLVLKRDGYKYCQSRKKGLLTKKDILCRLNFARKVRKLLDPTVWTDGISFYLDGSSFTHKYNPYDQARAPKNMAWRKSGEGLQHTTKGSHEGTAGKVAHFICCIAFGKGVILAEQYYGNLNGQLFAAFVREHFPKVFAASANPTGKLFLQDGDPSQNSKKAMDAIYEVGGKKFTIPTRSPDLNPIENVFNNVKRHLQEEALEQFITRENFEQFSERVKRTLENFPINVIDKTVASMNNRISAVIKGKGKRIRY